MIYFRVLDGIRTHIEINSMIHSHLPVTNSATNTM